MTETQTSQRRGRHPNLIANWSRAVERKDAEAIV